MNTFRSHTAGESRPHIRAPKGQAPAISQTRGTAGDAFFDGFITQFISVGEKLCVTEEQRQEAIALCRQADQTAALDCMESFGTTDFRDDLMHVSVPTLILHDDTDGIVPFEGSGKRTQASIPQSELVMVPGVPHGLNVSHAEQFDTAPRDFLGR